MSEQMQMPDLTPRQFHWMLATYHYIDRVQWTQDFLSLHDPEVFANVYADMNGADTFRFDHALQLIISSQAANESGGFDPIDPEVLKTQWLAAAAQA